MFNNEGFGNGSANGYGYNDNGTEKDANDYYAENPDTTSDDYEANYQQAQQEEDDEIRDLYPGEYEPRNAHEAIRDARRNIAEINQRLDEIEQIIKSTPAGTAVTAENLSKPETTATTRTPEEIAQGQAQRVNAEDMTDAKQYVGKDNLVYSSSKEAK